MSTEEKTIVVEPVADSTRAKTLVNDTTEAKLAPVSSEAEKKAVESDSGDSEDETAHLHAKTWLAVLAVCMIYFAQLMNLVGAGAVSTLP